MGSDAATKVWLALGASLGVSGGFSILIALPKGGPILWLGVGLVAVGSLALRIGLHKSRKDSSRRTRTPPRASQPPRNAAVEPELLRPIPRRVRMTRRGRTVVATWMLALAAFGTASQQHFSRMTPPRSKSILEQEGFTATATVHSLEARTAEGGKTLYFAGYNFVTENGAPVRVSRSVSRGVYGRLEEGGTTEVVYLPGNPDNHYLPDITSPVSSRFIFFAGGILLAAAGFAEAQRRLHRRLVAQGTAVAGLTADVRRRGGVRSFLVDYDAGGKRHTVRARERNPTLRSGQPVTVLYDPSIATRAVVYRLALYRAAS